MVLKLWDKIGVLDELDSINVLTQLFTSYESLIKREPENTEAILFFRTLQLVLDQVEECNLNRR